MFEVARCVTIYLTVLLSTLHPSSLGSLYPIVPSKLHALWYSPPLPVLFFDSAIGVGFAMTTLESAWARRAFHQEIPLNVVQKMGEALLVLLVAYGVLRIWDMAYRGSLGAILVPGEERSM